MPIPLLRTLSACLIWLGMSSWGYAQSQGEQLPFKDLRVRLSYEQMPLRDFADMGLVGIGVDAFGLVPALPRLYLGLGSYSATVGQFGGLFTFGGQVGYAPFLHPKWLLDVGFFLGGGGGAAAPDGDGIAVRPHVALEYRVGQAGIRGEIVHHNFLTGSLSGTYAALGLSLNTRFLYAPTKSTTWHTPAPAQHRLAVSFLNYHLREGSVVRPDYDYDQLVGLLGIQYDYFLAKHLYATLELYGAGLGGIDGYMSYLLGAGLTTNSQNRLSAELRGLAGNSGGGAVLTGGGLTLQAELALNLNLWQGYFLRASAGETFAPDGKLSARHFEVGFGMRSFNYLAVKAKPTLLIPSDSLKSGQTEIYFGHQQYLAPQGITDKNQLPYRDMGLLVMGARRYLRSWLSLAGQTRWAYLGGDYGAYAEGLLGLGLHKQVLRQRTLEISLPLYLGAGGGGGIDRGSGIHLEYGLSLAYAYNDWKLIGGLSQISSPNGNYQPLTWQVGCAYLMPTLTRISQKR
ncbi:MAG: hypothetical protein ACFCUI_00870 [Bernardetiaceae bacterium]